MPPKYEIRLAIAKVRRDMPRNALIMDLCNWFEEVLRVDERAPLTRAQIQKNYRARKKQGLVK